MPLTVAQLVARLTADTSGFYRGMAIANSAMIRSGGIIGRVAAGAGLATLGMGIMSVRAAGNFEESMNVLQAVSDATGKDMDRLRQEAVRLGADMRLPNVSAKDAANAMQELAKGGLSVNDTLKATRGTLQLGLAANIAFSDSATVVARALQAFGKDGSHAATVADLFTAAANKSTAEMTDIALGFQMASAQFAAGDQTIQGLTTSLTLMANAGIVGSDAGTSLKTMMNRLMAPTDKARKLMKEMGIEVYGANGNMKPMPGIIKEIEEGLKGQSKEQRNANLYTLFGSDAIRAARVQLAAGADGWREMEARITKGGEAQAFAEARTKGFNGALQAFGSVVETIAIQLGTAMLPILTDMIRGTAEWLNTLDVQKIIDFFTAIKDGVVGVYDFITGNTLLLASLTGLLAGFVAYRTIVGTIIAVTRAWTVAQLALNAAVRGHPLALIATALIALAAGLYVAYQRSEEFRRIVDQVFAFVRSAARWVVEAAQSISHAFDEMWNDVRPTVMDFLNTIRTVWNTIRSITTSIWDAIGDDVISVLAQLRGALTSAFNLFRTIVTSVWTAIASITRANWTAIFTIISNIIGMITGRISVMQGLRNIVAAVWTAIRTVTSTTWQAILSIVRSAVNEIPGILSGIVGAAASAAAGIGSAIFNGILGGLGDIGGAIKDKIIGGITSAFGSVRGFLESRSPSKKAAEEIGKPIADGILMGYLNGSAELPTKMKESLQKALDKGKEAIEEARGSYSNAFSRIVSDALSAFDAITQAHMTPSEARLAKLEGQRDAQERADTLANAQRVYNEMLAASVDYARKEEETEADYALRIKEAEKKLGEERLAAKKELDDARFAILKFNLEREAEQERLQYEARRGLQKRHLEDRLVDLEEQLKLHPERHDFYQNKILTLLRAHGVGYKNAGLALGKAFARGMRESFNDVEKAAKAIANLVARYLKLGSPAKEGPLSDLDSWWKTMGQTLASGINLDAIRSPALALAGAVGPTIGASGALPASASAAAGSVTNIFNFPQYVGSRDELLTLITAEIDRNTRQSGPQGWD